MGSRDSFSKGSGERPQFAALVLVVDDDSEQRRLTEAVLSQHGYGVVEAADGRIGIERLSECTPDLVLLDLHMPVMNGWEFRAEQQEMDQHLATIPVLLVTGEELAARYAALMNVSGLLRKPFEPDALLTAVGKALGR